MAKALLRAWMPQSCVIVYPHVHGRGTSLIHSILVPDSGKKCCLPFLMTHQSPSGSKAKSFLKASMPEMSMTCVSLYVSTKGFQPPYRTSLPATLVRVAAFRGDGPLPAASFGYCHRICFVSSITKSFRGCNPPSFLHSNLCAHLCCHKSLRSEWHISSSHAEPLSNSAPCGWISQLRVCLVQ